MMEDDEIKNLCRICLVTITSESDCVFNDSSELSESGILYTILFNLKICNDDLPIYLCNYCALQLKLFHKFKMKAIESYELLKQTLHAKCENNEQESDDDFVYEINYSDEECESIVNHISNGLDNLITKNLGKSSTSIDRLEQQESGGDDKEMSTIENVEIIGLPNKFDDSPCINKSIMKIEQLNESDNEIEELSTIIEDRIEDNDVDFDVNSNNIDSTTNNGNDTKVLSEIEEFEEVQYLDDDDIDLNNLHNENDDTIGEDTNSNANNDDDSDGDINEYDDDDEMNTDKEKKNDSSNASNKKKSNKSGRNSQFNKIYSCKKCNQSFSKKNQLCRHRMAEHGRIKLACSQCTKICYSEEALETHLRVHSGLPAYQCLECPRTFNQKQHYEYHMKSHRNERNVQCHLCGKGFITNSDLKIHLRVHNDERRYECDVCGKRFRANTHMTNHRYSHYEEKIECELCHQKYSCPNVLRTHIRSVHLNESPYTCDICHKRFKRKHHLKAHYKTHIKAGVHVVDDMYLVV